MYVCVRVCMMVNHHHAYTHKRAYNYSEYVILCVKAVSKHVHIPHYTPNYIATLVRVPSGKYVGVECYLFCWGRRKTGCLRGDRKRLAPRVL